MERDQCTSTLAIGHTPTSSNRIPRIFHLSYRGEIPTAHPSGPCKQGAREQQGHGERPKQEFSLVESSHRGLVVCAGYACCWAEPKNWGISRRGCCSRCSGAWACWWADCCATSCSAGTWRINTSRALIWDSLGSSGSASKVTAIQSLVFLLIIAVDSIIAMILDSVWVVTRSALRDLSTISSISTSIVYVLLKYWVTQSIFTYAVSSTWMTNHCQEHH